LTKEVEERVQEMMEERSDRERWDQVTRMAEEAIQIDEARKAGEPTAGKWQQRSRAKATEPTLIIYSSARTPANPLSRVTGTLSTMINVNQVLEHPQLHDSWWSTNLLGQGTAEIIGARMEDASNIRLYNASGEKMAVVGQSDILVRIPGLARQAVLTFLVTPDLPREE
jgi:hypothetical protein